MNCLCCGKPLKTDDGTLWHKACIRRFFGTATLPEIKIDEDTLTALALENTGKGVTVPGVQKKLSLHLLSDTVSPRLTLVDYPTGYILKPQVADFEALPQAEHLVMSMADATGIATVPHALICQNGEIAYLTKRIDRRFGENSVELLAMEDFCQLDRRLTEDKYRGSYERCAKVIRQYSSRKQLDLSELFLRLVFSYVVGNSDMHLKNFSLIEPEVGSGRYVLSAAYDLLPVNVVMPEDTEEFALAMNGKKQNLRKKDFMVFADACGIQKNAAEKMIAKVLSMKKRYLLLCEESLLPDHLKQRFAALMEKRSSIF